MSKLFENFNVKTFRKFQFENSIAHLLKVLPVAKAKKIWQSDQALDSVPKVEKVCQKLKKYEQVCQKLRKYEKVCQKLRKCAKS